MVRSPIWYWATYAESYPTFFKGVKIAFADTIIDAKTSFYDDQKERIHYAKYCHNLIFPTLDSTPQKKKGIIFLTSVDMLTTLYQKEDSHQWDREELIDDILELQLKVSLDEWEQDFEDRNNS